MLPNFTIDRWYGRLCNNLLQLAHGIYLAETLACKFSSDIPHEILNPVSYDFTNSNPNSELKINDTLYYFAARFPGLEPPTLNQYRRLFLETLRQDLEVFKCASDVTTNSDLVIHIRSGDIFNTPDKNVRKRLFSKREKPKPVQPNYAQPPLSYYVKIIESNQWNSIKLIAEDSKNPVIDKLLRGYPQISFEPQSLVDDLREILNCPNLVIGNGSFGVVLALLSNKLVNLYTPVNAFPMMGQLNAPIRGIGLHSFTINDYIYNKPWTCSKKQRSLMLSHDGAAISKETYPALTD